jgi:ribosomal RNA methyltransferase Nop2
MKAASVNKKKHINKKDIALDEEEEYENEDNNEMEEEEEQENDNEIEENEEDEEDNEMEEDDEGEGEDETKPIKSKNKNKNNDEDENENENEDQAPIDALNMDIPEMKIRIHKLVEILSDFKNKKTPERSRSDYISELKTLLIQTYDYNDDICNLVLNLFPPNECVEFMESNTTAKALTIRTNTLKTKRRELAKTLISRNINLDPLAEWSKVGLKIYSSPVPIGATPEYLAGHYMLQAASSFLPVLALEPQPGEKVLDMCACPGGKTTYIAQLMKNQGIVIANDMKKERIKSLFFNIHRMGIKNCIITNYDGRKFPKFYNSFDRVLLDAPCSGLGVIAKDQSVKVNRTYKEILDNSRVQKELILAAIDSCNVKGSGIIVYSTCSVAVEENEWVVDYALKYRYVKCIEVGFEVGESGLSSFREKRFHPSVKNCRRIYPHVHNMDGFFVAKLKKYADGVKGGEKEKEGEEEKKKRKNKSKKEKKGDEDGDVPELVEDDEEEGEEMDVDEEEEDDDDENDGIYDDDEDEEEYEKMDYKKERYNDKKDKKQNVKGNGKDYKGDIAKKKEQKQKENLKESKGVKKDEIVKKEEDVKVKKQKKEKTKEKEITKKQNEPKEQEVPKETKKKKEQEVPKETKKPKEKTKEQKQQQKEQEPPKKSKKSKETEKEKEPTKDPKSETLLNKKRKKSK